MAKDRVAAISVDANTTSGLSGLAAEYVQLLKRSLTGTVHQHAYVRRATGALTRERSSWAPWLLGQLQRGLARRRYELVTLGSTDDSAVGGAWPLVGETMIGLPRLDNLQACIERVVADGVPGDLIETGVWRGGASIFMRGVLRALNVRDRTVWLADSFQGLPNPDPRFGADAGDLHHTHRELAVSLQDVKANFERYGLLDEQVRFLPGWFSDTLGTLGDERWALIRLDGDMYQSTIEALTALYPRLSPGGYVIVDDGSLAPCRAAVEDYRRAHEIDDPIEWIDWTGFFWRRGR